jgi:hypothetical protein
MSEVKLFRFVYHWDQGFIIQWCISFVSHTEVICLDDSEEEGTTTLQGHDLNKIPVR